MLKKRVISNYIVTVLKARGKHALADVNKILQNHSAARS